MSNRIRLDPPL